MARGKLVFVVLLLALVVVPGAARSQVAPTFTGPAGTYQVVAPGPVTLEYGAGFVTIRWSGTPVPPGPSPPPAPTPTPKTSEPIFVSLVLTADAKPVDAAVRDQLLMADWASLKAGFRAYVEGQAELDTLKLQSEVAKAKAPCLIVQVKPSAGDSWPVLKTIPGPFKSAAEVLDAIKGLR